MCTTYRLATTALRRGLFQQEALGAGVGFDAGERKTRDMKEVLFKLDDPKTEEREASTAGGHGDPGRRQTRGGYRLGYFCPS
jgi:hypothetical protein